MADYPPVPPRPFDHYDDYRRRPDPSPPAVPPLPPDFRPDDHPAPHFEDPLVAPRPHKLHPDLPANMARTLDQQMQLDPYRTRSPRPPGALAGSPAPPQAGSDWIPWAGAGMPQPAVPGQPVYQPRPTQPLAPGQRPRNSSLSSSYPPHPSPGVPAVPPSLTAPLPSPSALAAQLPAVQQPSCDTPRRIAWIRDVFFLFDRAPDAPGPELARLAGAAIPLLLPLATERAPPLPEAVYLLATAEASGAHAPAVPQNPRGAFRHFEQAAKAGFHAAWFRLGRDYETFGDAPHAKQCFERGAKQADESSLYRMGMAHLLGQLGLPANPDAALPLLHRAATLASLESPQPAYVFGLLLLGEFAPAAGLPPAALAPFVPAGSSSGAEARRHLERAAFLGFAAAQYKLGHAYEFAQAPFPFDALLSVQYYSLASQQGEFEADMALSKWFLCGSEGAFDKDEGLAWTFAEKAARKGLPSAEFAMGYYAEVGVGGPKDIDAAVKWYTKAAHDGNTDAADRLKALSQPAPQALSRDEHENLTNTTLVRKRTQAKQLSDARPAPADGHSPHSERLNHLRKNSLMNARAAAGPASAGSVLPPVVEQPSPHHQHHHQQERGRPSMSGPNESANSLPGSASASPQRGGAAPYGAPSPSNSLSPTSGQRPFANATRYSLVDPGSGSASPSASPRPSGQGPRPSQGGGGAPPLEPEQEEPPRRHPAKGPQTFEEMGFHSQKLEQKECVIM